MNFVLKQSQALVVEFTREERKEAIMFLESIEPANGDTKDVIDMLISQLKMSLAVEAARKIH
jgi:hypothetical protein